MSRDWIASIVRRDRAITAIGLAALTGLAWLYLVRAAADMAEMSAMGMVHVDAWTTGDATVMAAMWAVMMIAMMTPSAAPMILTFAAVRARRGAASAMPGVSTGIFVVGYLVVWIAFSVAATLGQWALHAAALLSPTSLAATPRVGAAFLAVAGIYQLTPLKYACLSRCQTPIGFLLSEWREGSAGALVMGARHGMFCLGCCWVLMLLLFVGGVMNLAWVAALAGFVLLEKLLPVGRLVSWASGALLLAWAAWSLRV